MTSQRQFMKVCYSTDFHHLYNHSIHHSLTTHLHSGTVAVPVRSLSGSIIGIEEFPIIGFYLYHVTSAGQSSNWTTSGIKQHIN